MCTRHSKLATVLEKIAVQLIFLLLAALVLLLGIRLAGKTILFAQAEKIEIINNLVDGMSETATTKFQPKKIQGIICEYLEAMLRAVAGFEFFPRNDLMVLPQIIHALPEETEISSFVYHGRDLTIRTVQQDAESVYEMVDRLEQWVSHEEKVFEKVVYSYYLDADGRCIAEITLISYQYQDYDLREELEKRILPDRQEQD